MPILHHNRTLVAKNSYGDAKKGEEQIAGFFENLAKKYEDSVKKSEGFREAFEPGYIEGVMQSATDLRKLAKEKGKLGPIRGPYFCITVERLDGEARILGFIEPTITGYGFTMYHNELGSFVEVAHDNNLEVFDVLEEVKPIEADPYGIQPTEEDKVRSIHELD